MKFPHCLVQDRAWNHPLEAAFFSRAIREVWGLRSPAARGFVRAGLCMGVAAFAFFVESRAGAQTDVPRAGDLHKILPAENCGYTVAAAGLSLAGAELETLEPVETAEVRQNRLVIVAGLDAKPGATRAAWDFMRWWFGPEAVAVRRTWRIAVLPAAFPDGVPVSGLSFPPNKGFFNDTQTPESRFVWRWCAMNGPDMVVDLREAHEAALAVNAPARALGMALFSAAGDAAVEELVGAFGQGAPSGFAPVAAVRMQGTAEVLEKWLRELVSQAVVHSPLRTAWERRAAREPLALARMLAARYPTAPGMSYIPALAWSGAFRVSAWTGDGTFRQRALSQMRPFLSGEKPAMGKAPGLPAVAGHLAFSDWAALEGDAQAAALAKTAADALRLPADSPEVIPQATRWTDDMFMASSVLSRVAGATGDMGYAAAVQRLLTSYAARLQRADGVFVHVESSPFAWGRGNGFAAWGVMDALTHLPVDWAGRAELLAVYRKHLRGLLPYQSPDGMWRQVIDQPGAYREFTATAMITTAMARGVRLGWLDAATFDAAIERAWRALAVRIAEDGSLLDVCAGTGAKKDCDVSYYLRRDALSGPDERGGAMALTVCLEMRDYRVR